MPNSSTAQHDFKGLADWIEVFKAGTHTDSQGRSCTFTEADLDQMVSNIAIGAPPAVLGHPKHNDPAYAWGREAKRDGASLFMKFADIDPRFAANVDSGAYRNRSVAVIKDKAAGWRIRHVGWLGAAPPAIDGLQALDYSAAADPDETHEFADSDDLGTAYALDDVAQLLRGLRDQLIADKGVDAANTALPDWRITSVAAAAERLRTAAMADDTTADPAPLFTAKPGATMPTTITEQDLERARNEARVAAEAEAALKFSAQGAELTELRAARLADKIGTQVNAWKAAGKLTPAEAAGVAEFMAALEGGQTAEFQFTAAGASEPATKTPAQWFADFVAARRPVVQLGARQDDKDVPAELDKGDANAIAKAASEFIAAEAGKGRTVGAAQAVQHVINTAA